MAMSCGVCADVAWIQLCGCGVGQQLQLGLDPWPGNFTVPHVCSSKDTKDTATLTTTATTTTAPTTPGKKRSTRNLY